MRSCHCNHHLIGLMRSTVVGLPVSTLSLLAARPPAAVPSCFDGIHWRRDASASLLPIRYGFSRPE
jgi:hypothetical protein